MVEAENLCDRIAIMDSGRILALNTPANLKKLAATSSCPNPSTMHQPNRPSVNDP
ncbi:MAG: hypothetical protein WAM60_14990 [Candidatus Promineifilaceae bacterium]